MSDSQTPVLEASETFPVSPSENYSPYNDPEKIRVGIALEATELSEDFKWPEYHPIITDDCRSALFKYAIGGEEIEKRWQYAIAEIAHYDRFGRRTPGFPVSWFFRHLSAAQARLLDHASSFDPEFRKGNKVEVEGLYQSIAEEYPSEISLSIFKKALKSLLKREILSGYHTMASQVFLRFPIDDGKMCFKAENHRLFSTLTYSNVCVYCGKWLTPKNYSRDHVDPKCQGGPKEATLRKTGRSREKSRQSNWWRAGLSKMGVIRIRE